MENNQTGKNAKECITLQTPTSIIKQQKNLVSQRGLTLIALVVTIIVLLILAGVTLFVVLGDDGIFSKTATAKYAQARATIEEVIELGRGYAETYRYENPNSYMDKLAEYLNNDNALKSISPNTSATKVEGYILLKVGDEFNYKITEKETVFLGNKDEAEEALRPEVVDLKSSNIEFSYSTSAPTNGSVGIIKLNCSFFAMEQMRENVELTII